MSQVGSSQNEGQSEGRIGLGGMVWYGGGGARSKRGRKMKGGEKVRKGVDKTWQVKVSRNVKSK